MYVTRGSREAALSNGSHAKRGFEITLRPHYYKVFVEGSGEALFTKRASPVNAYKKNIFRCNLRDDRDTIPSRESTIDHTHSR
jgi:hypothetical protein